MAKVWSAVRTKVGLAVVGGALALTGAGVGTAAATGVLGTETVSDSTPSSATTSTEAASPTVSAVTPSPEPTPIYDETQAAVSAPAQQPQQPAAPVGQEPAATGQAMTVPPGVTPIDPNDLARGGYDAAGNPVQAIPVPKPGEPPVIPGGGMVPAEPLPGEPGYQGPVQMPASP